MKLFDFLVVLLDKDPHVYKTNTLVANVIPIWHFNFYRSWAWNFTTKGKMYEF